MALAGNDDLDLSGHSYMALVLAQSLGPTHPAALSHVIFFHLSFTYIHWKAGIKSDHKSL